MRQKRSLAILVIVVLLGAAVAGAAWKLSEARLPDPATADRDGLMRWMVTRDLTKEPAAIRIALVDRMEIELRDGVILDNVDRQIDEQQSLQFWSNVDFLLAKWFAREADRYAAWAADQRLGKLNERIDDVFAWQCVRDLRNDYRNGDRAGGEAGLIVECQKRTKVWIEGSQPPRSERMEKLMADATVAIAVRQVLGTLRSPDE